MDENLASSAAAETSDAAPGAALGAMGAAFKKVARKSAEKSAAKASQAALGVNVLELLYGKPEFRLPERTTPFARKLGESENTSNRRMALVTLPYMVNGQPSGFTMEASIYRRDERFQKGKQWQEKRTVSFAFPKNSLKPMAGDVVAGIHTQNFQGAMVEAYEKWIATVDTSKLVKQTRSSTRSTVVDIEPPDGNE